MKQSNRQQNDATIGKGSSVELHYKLSHLDGTIIDQTADAEPLEIVVGDETFPVGVEALFYGLKPGDTVAQVVEPENGWGHPDPANIQFLKPSAFNDDSMLESGKVIEFTLPDGQSLPGTILSVDEDRVEVDFNPPLAGQDIIVEVTILSVA